MCLIKNGHKWSTTVKTVKNCRKLSKRFFLNIFDSFLTVFDRFFLTLSDSVWQTFFFINTVTQCDKLCFLKYSDPVRQTFFQTQWSFFSGKFILRKKEKIGYLSQTNFNIEKKWFRVPSKYRWLKFAYMGLLYLWTTIYALDEMNCPPTTVCMSWNWVNLYIEIHIILVSILVTTIFFFTVIFYL